MMGWQNMDDLSKAKIVVIISFFVAIALFLKLCIFGYSGKRRFIRKAYEKGNYTKAYIVNNNIYTGTHAKGNANNFPSYKAKYEYTVADKKYYKSYNFRARSAISSGPPHSINVYYDGLKPSKAISEVEVKNGPRASGCFTTIAIVIVFSVVFYNVWKMI